MHMCFPWCLLVGKTVFDDNRLAANAGVRDQIVLVLRGNDEFFVDSGGRMPQNSAALAERFVHDGREFHVGRLGSAELNGLLIKVHHVGAQSNKN